MKTTWWKHLIISLAVSAWLTFSPHMTPVLPFNLTTDKWHSFGQYLPAYLDNESDSLVMPIIRRHETLSITHQRLQQRLERLEEEVEEGQRQLHTMKQEQTFKKLVRHFHRSFSQKKMRVTLTYLLFCVCYRRQIRICLNSRVSWKL